MPLPFRKERHAPRRMSWSEMSTPWSGDFSYIVFVDAQNSADVIIFLASYLASAITNYHSRASGTTLMSVDVIIAWHDKRDVIVRMPYDFFFNIMQRFNEGYPRRILLSVLVYAFIICRANRVIYWEKSVWYTGKRVINSSSQNG